MNDRTLKIHLIADDFGMNAETNAAIMHCFFQGALTGASLMMGQPGTEEAIALAKENPNLAVGIHFHLTDSTPMTISSWAWGRSPTKAGIAIGMSSRARALACAELEAQWMAYKESGLPCSFVNTHHHLHAHPYVFQEMADLLCDESCGWIRLGAPHFFCPACRLLRLWRIYGSPDYEKHMTSLRQRLYGELIVLLP